MDAPLIRALATTLRGEPSRAQEVRGRVRDALKPEGSSLLELLACELDDDVVDKALERANSTTAEESFTSVLVIGEIRRGIDSLKRKDVDQASKLEEWLEQIRGTFAGRILAIEEPVAELWGRLSVPDLPVIDGLLTATAMVRGFTLVTRNTMGLKRTGVRLLNPFAA